MNRAKPSLSDAILLQHSQELLFLLDPGDLTIVAANPAASARLGYEAEQLSGRPITDIGRALSDVFYWEEVLAGNVEDIDGAEGLYRCADGSLFPVEETVSLVAYDGIPWLVVRARDITAEKDEHARLESISSLLRATLESTADGILVCDDLGGLVNMNQRFAILWALPEELLAQGRDTAVLEFMAGRCVDAGNFLDDFHRTALLRDEETLHRLELADGQVLEQRSRPQYLEERIIGRVFTYSDITERLRAERNLSRREQEFRSLVEGSPDNIIRYDTKCRAVYVNSMTERSVGVRAASLLGRTPLESRFEGIDGVEHYQAAIERVLATGESENVEVRLSDRQGNRRIHHIRVVPQHGDGEITGALAFGRDITEIVRAEVELRIAAIAFESREAIAITDSSQVIIKVNGAFCRITGYSAEEALGRTPSQLLKSGRHSPDFYREMWDALNRERHWQGEVWNRRKNGEIYPEWLHITAVTDGLGRISNYVASFSDITEHKQAEAEIHNLAFYDPLTALPNRRLLLDRLEHTLATSARNHRHGAVFIIDLDRFKELNDTRGHSVGDLLLVEVARRLQSCVRPDDTVARLGGDEFVVVLVDLSRDERLAAIQAETVALKIRDAVNRPFALPEGEYHSSPSIGICLFAGQAISLDELVKRADTAMYEAKRSGRNAIRFFDPATHAAMEARISLETDLRRALPEGQLSVHYQPQVDLAGRIVSAEALLRWSHPEKGAISPQQFIPLAEESGLIVPIGLWVLQTACAQLKAWQADSATRQLSVAVNVSAHQFRQDDFVDKVLTVLAASGVEPGRLKLELTESLVLDDVEDTIAKMQALKAAGVGFSLDDFGTGYSSLAYLSRLPLDQIKIDQSFVRNIGAQATDEVIVQTIIGMAATLGLDVIAEGVETAQQRSFLVDNGCAHFQGYFFGRPEPIAAFAERLGQR